MKEIKIHETELIERNKLIVDKQNPNYMDDRQIQALKEVVTKYGFTVPIICNKDFKIIDGHQRWRVARELSIDKIPTIVLDVDEVDHKILQQVMNKLKGQHRKEMDEEIYKYVESQGSSVELMNYLPDSRKEIKDFLDKKKGVTQIKENPELVDKLGGLMIKCPKCGIRFEKKGNVVEK